MSSFRVEASFCIQCDVFGTGHVMITQEFCVTSNSWVCCAVHLFLVVFVFRLVLVPLFPMPRRLAWSGPSSSLCVCLAFSTAIVTAVLTARLMNYCVTGYRHLLSPCQSFWHGRLSANIRSILCLFPGLRCIAADGQVFRFACSETTVQLVFATVFTVCSVQKRLSNLC